MSLLALSTRPCRRGFSDWPRRPINLYIKFLVVARQSRALQFKNIKLALEYRKVQKSALSDI